MLPAPSDPVSYTISGAVAATGVPRSSIYLAAARGDLVFKKIGKRSLILAAELRRWIEDAPNATIRQTRRAA